MNATSKKYPRNKYEFGDYVIYARYCSEVLCTNIILKDNCYAAALDWDFVDHSGRELKYWFTKADYQKHRGLPQYT